MGGATKRDAHDNGTHTTIAARREEAEANAQREDGDANAHRGQADAGAIACTIACDAGSASELAP